jgi:hypothetical protein
VVATAEARNVADTDFIWVHASKNGVEFGPHLVTSAKVATHVSADSHVHLRGRAEMKVRIEARDRVNLTYWDIDFCRKRVKPVGWQVSEIALYGPQLVKHDSRLRISNVRSNLA